MSEGTTIRVVAGVLNNVVSLLEAYLEVPDGRLTEVKRWLDQAGADLCQVGGVSTAQVQMLLASAAWARGGGAAAAQPLWESVAALRDELLERHAPPPEPRRLQW